MTAYTVTAENRVFYMELLVEAQSAEEAAKTFRSYLSDQEHQEEEEYEMALDVAEDGKEPDREDFVYDFEDEDIAEFEGDAWNTPSERVQLISSGANG